MTVERDSDGRIIKGQKSLNPRGRPKKTKEPEPNIDFDVDDELSAYDTLKFLLKVYMQKKDWAGVERVANKLAPFQTAKLATVDSLETTHPEITITLPELPQLAPDDEIWEKIRETPDSRTAQLRPPEVSASDSLAED
jgi:hypothetical protein